MKIGFEAKRFFTNVTGLGNYSRFVVDALSKFHPENEYILYTPRTGKPGDTQHILARQNVHVVTPPNTYKMLKASSLWRTWGISRHSSMNDLNVFHGLSHELPMGLPAHIRSVVTVHDLIFLRYPQFYNQIDAWIYKSKLAYACREADKIIAISNQTASDLVEFLGVDPAKIDVIYQGCHANFRTSLQADEINSVRKKYNLPSEYLLNVGTVEPRKNILQLIRAMALLPAESGLPLVVLGRHTPYFKTVMEEASRLKLLDKIIFMENIPFNDFPAIYQGAKIFIYPSLFEGFGIPLVEAIESNVPVITSRGSCFSEAAGPAAQYVDPLDPGQLADSIIKVLSDDQLQLTMKRESYQHVQQFRPEIVAQSLMTLYDSFAVPDFNVR